MLKATGSGRRSTFVKPTGAWQPSYSLVHCTWGFARWYAQQADCYDGNPEPYRWCRCTSGTAHLHTRYLRRHPSPGTLGIVYTWLGDLRAGTLFFVWAAALITVLGPLAAGLLSFNSFIPVSLLFLLGFSFLLIVLLGGLLNSGGHMVWGFWHPWHQL